MEHELLIEAKSILNRMVESINLSFDELIESNDKNSLSDYEKEMNAGISDMQQLITDTFRQIQTNRPFQTK